MAAFNSPCTSITFNSDLKPSVDTHIAAYHILETYEDFEFLHAFLAIKVLMVICPDTTYCKVEPVAHYILVDSGNFKAEHHPFIVDGLILLQ